MRLLAALGEIVCRHDECSEPKREIIENGRKMKEKIERVNGRVR